MSLNLFIVLIIVCFAVIMYASVSARIDWVLDTKLKIFEKAIKKRHRLENQGKKGKLLKEIDKGMWSYNRMLFSFWEKDVSKMFTDEEIRQYLYERYHEDD